MTAADDGYHARMRRVIDHIDRHPDDALDLATLSGVAAFSRFHFQRQFAATFGLSPHRYVQLARMKRAAYRLGYRPRDRVTDIALDAGYGAPDAFARAFRHRFGQSPSAFRRSPDWAPWHAALAPFHDARSRRMHPTYTHDDVTIRDLPPTPVAILRHRGDPARIGDTIRRFIAWRTAAGLPPRISATFNVFHDDPHTTPPADYRMDLCAGTDRPVAPNAQGVVAGTIPGGRCAVLRVVGGTDDLEHAALFLYRDWLPASGAAPRDFPLYCQRLTLFPDVAEHEAAIDLFLPIA